MEENNNPIQEMGTKVEENPAQVNNAQTSSSANKKVNGACLASFILSIVGLFIAGLPCGIAALIVGITGIAKFNKDTEKLKWMGIVGIVIGVADVVLVSLNLILQAAQLTR